MRTVIIPARNVVLRGGKAHTVDCSSLDPAIHVIELGERRGVIEYINDREAGPDEFRANEIIEDFAPYQSLIDAWQTAEDNPDPPPPPNKPPDRPPIPPEIQAMMDRAKVFIADTDRKAFISRIKTATPAQIKTFIDNNVTDLASAKAALKQIALVLAIIVQGEPEE